MRLLLILLLLPSLAVGADALLSWDPPTEYEDGTALPANTIAGYKIYYSLTGDVTGSESPVVVAPGNQATVSITLAPRPEPYDVTFRIAVYLKDGRESVLSNSVVKRLRVDSTANPKPPTNIQITFACDVGCKITVIQ